MSEVYLYFFILLSIFLLLKSFKKESKHRIAYFIFGAISFGFALNIKLIAIEFVIPILVLILFYDSFNEKLNFRFLKNKKNVVKALSLVLVFFVISSIAFVATVPKYHDNTLNKILKISEESGEVGYTSLPTAEKNYLFKTLAAVQIILLPYIMDSYVHEIFSDEAQRSKLIETFHVEAVRSLLHLLDSSNPVPLIEPPPPSNYSTIPVLLFFFIGLIYIIRKIKTRNLMFSEFALLVLFTTLFIFTVLIVDYPWVERYYLPAMFPVMLIAAYGLGNFIKQIQSQKEKILFFTSFIIAHSLYIIPFFDKIYFSNNMNWLSPLPVSSQLVLNDPLVYVSTITFIMIFALIYIRIKTRIPVETREAKL